MKHLDKYFAVLTGYIAYSLTVLFYKDWTYTGVAKMAYSQNERPFVYRMLVPLLSRILEFLIGISAVWWLLALMVISAVGMYYSFRYLLDSFGPTKWVDVEAFIGCVITFAVSTLWLRPYDFCTAIFFTLALAFIARGKIENYYLIFPLATLNRETTFLLVIFYAAYYFNGPISKQRWFFGVAYQVMIWFAVRAWTMFIFRDLPGQDFGLNVGYLHRYTDNIWGTAALLFMSSCFVFAAVRDWKSKPRLLKIAFLSIFPLQIALHLTLGLPFETRVFVESIPTMIALVHINETPLL